MQLVEAVSCCSLGPASECHLSPSCRQPILPVDKVANTQPGTIIDTASANTTKRIPGCLP